MAHSPLFSSKSIDCSFSRGPFAPHPSSPIFTLPHVFPTCHTFSILPFVTLSQFSHLSHLPIVPICHTFSFFSFVTLPHPCVLPRVTPHLLPHVTFSPSMRFFPLATRVLPSSFYRSSSVSPPMRHPQRAARSTICSPVLSSPGRRPSPCLRCCFSLTHTHFPHMPHPILPFPYASTHRSYISPTSFF